MVSIRKGPWERRHGTKRRDEEKSATQEENHNMPGLFSRSRLLIHSSVDDPFMDSLASLHLDPLAGALNDPDQHIAQLSQVIPDPSSPSLKRHALLAPLIETQDEDTERPTPPPTQPVFMLAPSTKGNTGSDQHPSQVPPPHLFLVFSPTPPIPPKHADHEGMAGPGGDQEARLEGSRGVGYLHPLPAVQDQSHRAGHQFSLQDQFHAAGYPFPYFPYQANMYPSDPQAMYSVFHHHDFHPHDTSQFVPGMFPSIPPYANHPDQGYHRDDHVHLDPSRPVTHSPSVEGRHLCHPSAELRQ